MPVVLNRAVSGGVDLDEYVRYDTLQNPTPELVDTLKVGLGLRDIGAAADRSFEYIPSAAEAVWTINHGLNKYPSVSVIDSSGDDVEGDVSYQGPNRVVITFSAAISGKAFLN